ncbi:MAG: bifunctional lysine ketoglutarate reductase /saccharopine dehydrogenase family protein [Desulfococcaceae bacterium]|jgi:alpha-aminoadipic semialdehyde synthase|nr:bifunctional lysine ketoglutarate reductase /saccharopine dehydrogenase family protein [Desulfococcaceae bacterium]
MIIGIRKEDKSIWERRVPFIPSDIKNLQEKGISMIVQTSPQRAYADAEFTEKGIAVQKDLHNCDMIFGIKEIPPDLFEENKIYVFFAHVIKGQPHNMPMLRAMMKKKVTLVDYERVMDEQNRRLIFFGRYAGLAGMINSLWALGQRLTAEGIPNPFRHLKQARHYRDLDAAKIIIGEMAKDIEKNGIPDAIHPLIVGISGYGNVSKGAQEILDLLPCEEISADSLRGGPDKFSLSPRKIYKTVFAEKDCVQLKEKSTESPGIFDLADYYREGKKKYENRFGQYADYLTLLVNCVYWDNRYPRLLTKEMCRELWAGGKQPRLRVIGDISCDPEGAIECTVKATDPGNPVYVYEPPDGEIRYGFQGQGPVIMAVDILPTELPRESSAYFSNVLKDFVPALAAADFSLSYEELALPPELKKAVILYRGELIGEYEYIRDFL